MFNFVHSEREMKAIFPREKNWNWTEVAGSVQLAEHLLHRFKCNILYLFSI